MVIQPGRQAYLHEVLEAEEADVFEHTASRLKVSGEAIAHLGGVWRVLVMVGNLQIVHGLNGTYISR